MQMHWANLLQSRVRVMGMHLGEAGAGCGWSAAMSIDRADRRSGANTNTNIGLFTNMDQDGYCPAALGYCRKDISPRTCPFQ